MTLEKKLNDKGTITPEELDTLGYKYLYQDFADCMIFGRDKDRLLLSYNPDNNFYYIISKYKY